MKVQKAEGITKDERGVEEYWDVQYRITPEKLLFLDIEKPGKKYSFMLDPMGDSHFQGKDNVDGNRMVGLFIQGNFKATWGRWSFEFPEQKDEEVIHFTKDPTQMTRKELESEYRHNCHEQDEYAKELQELRDQNSKLRRQLKQDDADIFDFFSTLQKDVHANGVAKGWWGGTQKSLPLEIHALLHAEISEATEEVRKGMLPIYYSREVTLESNYKVRQPTADETGKPEGEAIELADVVIFILSYFESNGWNLGHALNLKCVYNKTRPNRDGYRKY